MATLAKPADDSVTIIARSSGEDVILAYPSAPPGQTVTKTIRLMVEEAQDRDLLADVDLDFTDDVYSDGLPASRVPDVATKVGTKVSEALRELTTYVDFRVAVKNGRLALQVYEKGTMGSTVDVDLEEDSNLIRFESDSELHGTAKLWVRWDGGWTYLDTGDGDEDVIEIGAPFSIEEVERMARAALNEVNSPKTEYTASLDTIGLGAAGSPYTAFLTGDRVTTPVGVKRVVSTGVTEHDKDGKTIITLGLGDLLTSAEARQAQDLAKQ
jgi:hypothetical protein